MELLPSLHPNGWLMVSYVKTAEWKWLITTAPPAAGIYLSDCPGNPTCRLSEWRQDIVSRASWSYMRLDIVSRVSCSYIRHDIVSRVSCSYARQDIVSRASCSYIRQDIVSRVSCRYVRQDIVSRVSCSYIRQDIVSSVGLFEFQYAAVILVYISVLYLVEYFLADVCLSICHLKRIYITRVLV